MTLLSLLLSCAAPTAPEPDAGTSAACDGGGATRVLVLRRMTFGRRVDGVSLGFDLDGHVSDDNDPEGCYQEDLVDPNGVEGIDNSFSGLLPILEATEGAAVEGLMQDAIDAGTLLVLLEVEDLDDPTSDPCVNLAISQGTGDVRLGTDGVLLSGQTFDRDPSVPPSRAEGISVVDGALEARGLAFTLPISVFTTSFSLDVRDAALSLQLDPLGGGTGYLSGGFAIQQIIDVIEGRGDISIADLAIDLLHSYADLNPDAAGACPDLSVVLEFEATSAFLYDDPPPDTGAPADTADTGESTDTAGR